MGLVVILAVFGVLWVTAPQWEGTLGIIHPAPTPPGYVYLNLTTWGFSGPAVCWQGTPFSPGGTVPVNGTFEASVVLAYPGGTTGPNCTAGSVRALTAGFTVQNSNAPVTVGPNQSGRLFVNLTVPATLYNGPLALSVITTST